jgi:hypothetical protein
LQSVAAVLYGVVVAGGRNGVKYAEETLAVHTVYGDAQAFTEALASQRKRAVELRAGRRYHEDLLEDRSFELLEEVRASDPAASHAATERKHKELVHTDDKCRFERKMLAALAQELDECETEIAQARTGIDICTARMHELGGYLAYLAALKNAEEPKDTWPSNSA